MPRKTKDQNGDSSALHEAVSAIITDRGRGGLSFVAREIGMTPSALKKRLADPTKAFDGPTLRAAILVMELQKQANPAAPSTETTA